MDWLDNFGVGDKERERLLAQVRGFIERHGASRFERTDSGAAPVVVRDRVGFLRETARGAQYLVLPEAFKSELTRRFETGWAIRELIREGWLMPGKDRPNQTIRVGGEPMRLYVLGPAVLTDESAGAAEADR